MLTIKEQKNTLEFKCDICDFKCCKKSNYEKHLLTRKHKNAYNCLHNNEKNKSKLYICINCKKEYVFRQSLYNHKKKCIIKSEDENTIISDNNLTQNSSEVIHLTNLVMKLMNSNEELQKQTLDMHKQMIDVCKTNNTTINNSNSNNKTFNMQVFLNEKCKDAMNIMDFVNSMTLELSDLEDVGELGYVEGISKIMIRKLNEMDVYKRPIHCSDYKREVMYVRDDDIWEKENSTYDKLRKAIKHITKKNGDLMIPWRDQNPQCMNNRHRLNDVYLRIMNQSMGGKGDFVDSENKIIKKLSKAVYINKDC